MNILVVDDEKIAAEGLVSAIKTANMECTINSFTRPKEALEFAKENEQEIAFLDIQMRGMNGVELARKLKILTPRINIIFTTGYVEGKGAAMDLRASGYLMKPITADKVMREINNLRYPVEMQSTKRVVVKSFGNFEVYIDNTPARFQYTKTKELFAYLINRQGALCTNQELIAILWEDQIKNSYFKNVRADMLNVLPREIFIQQWGRIGVLPDKISCDYYDWEAGDISAINGYTGEYMSQYSWAEATLGDIKVNSK